MQNQDQNPEREVRFDLNAQSEGISAKGMFEAVGGTTLAERFRY